MTFCGPARDTVLTNRQTEKLNFDTNYITTKLRLIGMPTILEKYKEKFGVSSESAPTKESCHNSLSNDVNKLDTYNIR
jgi:hypothetical protein